MESANNPHFGDICRAEPEDDVDVMADEVAYRLNHPLKEALLMRRQLLTKQAGLEHDGNNASIVLNASEFSSKVPWTPKALCRAKSAIIYKVCTFRACALGLFCFLNLIHLF
jgi:hypothetical protein